ncbi:LysE family translocator [Stappia sp. MMSF_3263]|uniref:LysE family translocator n=1 Tax=Stappia sp. MMSF_3263 TaxID=3046693 RepID=UPI00273D10C2|nr:LysE family translocator [Stappia sp. MMSF_3263]
MQEPFFFLVGLGVGLATSAPVGPINIAAIQRALRSGFLAGFCAGLGAVLADGLYASFAAFGVTAVSDFVDENSAIIQTVGGLLVIVFGIRILLSRPHLENDEEPSPSLVSGIATGFVMTVTNPGVVLGFLAIFGSLGKWAPDPGDYVGAAMLVAGVLTGALSWWVMLSALVSRLRLRMNDTWLLWINRGAGAALIAFGVAIFLHQYVLG